MAAAGNVALPPAIVVMGVAGSGKTTVGRRLAATLGRPFYDADDYHAPEAVRKMAAGIPLTDADRAPWLAALNRLLRERLAAGESPVLACSALRQSYREQLAAGLDGLGIVYLRTDPAVLAARLAGRRDHFMPPDMLASQLATLEEPDGLVVDGNAPADAVVAEILERLPDAAQPGTT